MNTSRTNILENIRKAIQNPSHIPEEQTNGLDKRIKDSLKEITPIDYKGLRAQFKKELETVSGEFHIVKDQKSMAQLIVDVMNKNNYTTLAVSDMGNNLNIANFINKKLSNLKIVDASKLDYEERRSTLAITNAALVDVAYAIADTGSLAVFSDDTPSMLPHFLPDCIFTVISPNQMLPNMFELLSKVPNEKLRKMVIITGPSRTADIEKILILGAHGPHSLIVGMIE